MALTLTIGGVNFLPRYKTGSLQVHAQIQNQGDSCSLGLVIKKGQTLPTIGQEIVFKDGTRFLFGGYVSRLTPTEYGVGEAIVYSIEAIDYTYILTNKNTQATYENQTLAYIVADLLTNSVDSGYALTHAGTATGPVIPSVTFNHISLRQCFEKLAKLTNYIWWVDYQKDIHFIDPASAAAAPETVTDASSNHESMVVNSDATQVRNQIIIKGGISESANYQQVILGDANARGWALAYGIITMVSIELDTGSGYVSKTYGLEGTDDETACYFMYSPTRGSFRMSSGSGTPAAGNKIRITYTYPLPILTIVQDAGSVTYMKSVEGGDGIHSYTINDTTIISTDQASNRGLQELAQFAYPTVQGTFRTRTGLLAAGSYFTPGQVITVNLPAWGINVDTLYVIQSVTTTQDEGPSGVEYHYQVTFGGRMIGVTDFLIALATPETAIDQGEALQKIFGVSDIVHITESITHNSNARNITESVSIAESISKANVTPPFKWGVNGTANKGVWNKSEWA